MPRFILIAFLLIPACGGESEDPPSNIMLILTTDTLLSAASEYAAYRQSGDFDVELFSTADLDVCLARIFVSG